MIGCGMWIFFCLNIFWVFLWIIWVFENFLLGIVFVEICIVILLDFIVLMLLIIGLLINK